jgi:dienelactone hydrolase
MRGLSKYHNRKILLSELVSLILLLSLCCSPFLVNAKTSTPLDSIGSQKLIVEDTWYDGSFSGIWTNDTTQGSFSGFLDLGRSNLQGKFQGNLLSQTGQHLGLMTGFFYKQWVVGSIQYDSQGVQRFVGAVQYGLVNFTLDVTILGGGSLSCEGIFESSFLPPLTGAYAVGVKTLDLIDESRDEWFSEDPSDHRELIAHIWYPTVEKDFQKRMDYMDPITFQWLKQQSPIPLITIPNLAYTYVSPHCYEGVQIAKDDAPYPVLIFSHGYDGVEEIYTSFIEDMVSNGYIVVSINHPYVAGITVFSDGRTMELAPVPFENLSGFFTRSLRTVVDDVYFVLNEISALNEYDAMLSGCFDLTRLGMYGHSFGGAATAVCCFEDERFKAGFTLDGVVYDEFLPGNISKPILMMLAEARINETSTLGLYEKVSTDAYMVGILGSTHYGYTDVGVLLSHLLPGIPQKLLGFGTIDAKRLVNITRVIELAFFDVYLKGYDKQDLFDTFSLFNDIVLGSK